MKKIEILGYCIPLEFLYVGHPNALRPLIGLLAKAAQAFIKYALVAFSTALLGKSDTS
jgi:hypothetical protein